jgi:betaine lipid synthase
VLQWLAVLCGMGKKVRQLANASSLEEQRQVWNSIMLVRFIKKGPALLVWLVCKLLSLLLCNRLVLWFGGGVPLKQYKLIVQDGIPIEAYVGRTLDGG